MATKKSDFMHLTKYLKAADVSGVTAVALDRAISAAIKDGTLTDMFPSTSKAEKYTIDADGKILTSMPKEGYQSYRNDYLILNEEQFDNWYTTVFKTASKSKGAVVQEVSLAALAAMTPEERAKHFTDIAARKEKQSAASSTSLKKEKEVLRLLEAGKIDEAEKVVNDWQPRGTDGNAMKSGLMEAVRKARRNSED